MSEVDHASNWDRLIFALELAVNSKINMELTTSQCKYLLDKLTSLTDRVADLEAERRWIPISEPPKVKGEYICYSKPDIFTCFFGDSWDGGFAFRSVIQPTHWMPLPPPPPETNR